MKAYLSKVFLITVFTLLTASLQIFCQSLKKEFPKAFRIEVSNTLNAPHSNSFVLIEGEKLLGAVPSFNKHAFVVLDNGKEISSQFIERDSDYYGLVLVLDQLSAGETRQLEVRYANTGVNQRSYEKRTQAELSVKEGGAFENRKYVGGNFKNVTFLNVPDEVTDHSFYIRYEGPGWESDKVAYRFYMDWRRGTDVFGKKVSDMVLQQIGLDGYDSYHEMHPWGMDVMKVGPSLGLGSPALFHHSEANRIDSVKNSSCQIVENGALFSSVLTQYFNWQVDGMHLNIDSKLSIHAGTRLTRHLLTLGASSEIPSNLCTGIGKDKNAKVFKSEGNRQQYGYLATYGKQSLNNDYLGLVVFFRHADFQKFTEDNNSHVVLLTPAGGKVEYFFAAAWEKELNGITSEEQFQKFVNDTANELAHPIQIEIVL